MEVSPTRRSFLAGATALALWPKTPWAADRPPGGLPRELLACWETADGRASDSVMVRRLYLDLAGRLPTKEEARTYVFARQSDKRARLVDRLLASEGFADYWTMRFCDILRVKSEFPINLWPNAVYVYARRIRAFVAGNESWSAFARALLTAQGSNFRDGEVNFFRATDTRTPDGWAQCVAQTFFGRAFTAQEAEERAYVSSRFANLRIKTTREWKEEIVYVEGPDRRADVWSWVFDRHRLRAKAAFEKRLNTWIFGLGDPGASLEGVSSDRLQDLLRAIVLSEAYARGSVTGGFPARRLDAEVLDDAFCSLSGFSRNYQSPAPEPFSFIPPKRPTVCLEDGSISSGFLSLFGRPARDTGTMAERGGGITAKQRLYLFNSRDIHNKIRAFSRASAKRPDDLYWNLLARAPTAHERRILSAAWTQRKEGAKNGKPAYSQFLQDVAWSLVNGKEFLLRT